jgi:hypothetical protein
MAKILQVVRKNVMLEQEKVQRLVKKLRVKSESEAIRIAIDNVLFADEVLAHVRELRRRGTLRDVYTRAASRRGSRR